MKSVTLHIPMELQKHANIDHTIHLLNVFPGMVDMEIARSGIFIIRRRYKMTYYDYQKSKEITSNNYPFNALIMAAMRKADYTNLVELKRAFPETFNEFTKRYDAPGGIIEGDQ